MKVNRSFVNRSRNLKPNQKLLFDELWSMYGLDSKNGEINFAKIFNNNLPTILEIGFGNGDNLLNIAKNNLGYNYLGIEVYLPGVSKLITTLASQNIHNVKIYHGDVMEVLACIPDESLAKVLIFFPDPWPKRRHHKRRLIQLDFVKMISNKLQQNGALHLATDWEDYAKHMLETMENSPKYSNAAGKNKFANRPDFRPLTKFEARGKHLGHQIFDLQFVKN